MFDFENLDDIDDNAATPEWLKWQGVAQWQRAPAEGLALLEDEREETYAAPSVHQQEDFVYLPLDIPELPQGDAFDPLALAEDSADALNCKMKSLNGQVIVNFASSAVEEFMLAKREREEHKAYIDHLHQQRVAVLDSKRGGSFAKKQPATIMERKAFSWRELRSAFNLEIKPLPKDGVLAETVLTATLKLTRSLVPVATGAMLPPSVLLHMLIGLATQVRPEPEGRFGRNKEKHLEITDVFFPTGMILNDASDIINKQREAPSLVHLVAMSVNKLHGDLEAKHLLDNIKLPTPASYPSIKPRYSIRR